MVALAVLLGGCVPVPIDTHPDSTATGSAQKLAKHVFVLRLIGICAGVNDFVAQEKRKNPAGPAPGQVADQLERLIGAAVTGAPDVERDKLNAMVAALRAWVRALRSQQQSNDERTRRVADDAAGKAVKAASGYGMPPLGECNKHIARWGAVEPLPVRLQQVASTVVNGRIWVIGGLLDEQKASAATSYYDPMLQHWVHGPALPMPLHHAMAVAYRGEPWVIGGWVPDGDSRTTSGRVLRLHDGRWQDAAPLVHPRAAGGAAVVGDRIVVLGGIDQELVRPTEVFDGSRWRAAASIPVPGDHIAAVSAGGYVYAVGGRDRGPDQNSGALQRFDPGTGRWARLPDMPSRLAGAGVASAGGRIHVVGGEDVTSASPVVQVYDIASRAWSTGPELPAGRHGLAAAVVGSRLYAIAGASAGGHESSTDTVEVLSLAAPSGGASTTATATTSTAAAPDLAACPDRAVSAYRACLTSARARAGTLVIRYTMNFVPSRLTDRRHHHAHVFTARPDGHGGTVPAATDIQSVTGNERGSWVSLYRRDIRVIDGSFHVSGRGRPLDASAPLLCVRVASGLHALARDRRGGLRTGNCVPIRR
jgi:hypothetical protein